MLTTSKACCILEEKPDHVQKFIQTFLSCRHIKQAVCTFADKVDEMYDKRDVTAADLFNTANDLDKIWRDCRIACATGKSAKIVGGILTCVGGILSIFTLGAAAPVAIAGLSIGVLGTATECGTEMTEGFLNSSKVANVERRKSALTKAIEAVENVATSWLKESKERLDLMHTVAKNVLGESHKAVSLINKALQLAGSSMGTVKGSIFNISQKVGVTALEWGSQFAKDGGKAAARAGASSAGAVVGASAFFVAVDTLNLAFTINDIVKEKGSDAAKELRKRAYKLNSM